MNSKDATLWACAEGHNVLCYCYVNMSNGSQCFDVNSEVAHTLWISQNVGKEVRHWKGVIVDYLSALNLEIIMF